MDKFINQIKNHKAITIILMVAIALLVFQAGIFVGYRKASFSYNSGDRYFHMMEGKRGPLGVLPVDDFAPSHGAAGRVVSVSLPNFIVASNDNVEKTIIIDNNTSIRRFRNEVAPEDIKVNDFVLVLGDPNTAGFIQARLIRLLPPPSTIPATK